MSDQNSTLPIDPKDLIPAAVGFFLGLCIIGGFALLCLGLGLTLFVDHSNIPYQ